MLVELKSDNFSAVVPNLNDMPAMRLISISLVKDPMWQYGMITNLLRENVSQEKHNEFDNLSNIEMQNIIEQWISKAEQ